MLIIAPRALARADEPDDVLVVQGVAYLVHTELLFGIAWVVRDDAQEPLMILFLVFALRTRGIKARWRTKEWHRIIVTENWMKWWKLIAGAKVLLDVQ